MSNKSQKKAKFTKGLHTAADGLGKFIRKSVPLLLSGVILFATNSFFNNKSKKG